MIINIKDTLTLDDNNEYVVISKINYEKVNPILELLRNDSKKWLLSAINE